MKTETMLDQAVEALKTNTQVTVIAANGKEVERLFKRLVTKVSEARGFRAFEADRSLRTSEGHWLAVRPSSALKGNGLTGFFIPGVRGPIFIDHYVWECRSYIR